MSVIYYSHGLAIKPTPEEKPQPSKGKMIKSHNPSDPNSGFTVTKSSMPMYRMLLMLNGLKMETETNGRLRLTGKAPTCYTLVKREYGLKGNLQKVLDQFEKIVERAKLDHAVNIQAAEVE